MERRAGSAQSVAQSESRNRNPVFTTNDVNADVIYLMDEEFDFDFSLSFDSSKCDEDSDDVFAEPSRHAAKRAPENLPSPLEDVGARSSWSPLSEVQMDAICREARRLAERLQRGQWLRSEDEAATAAAAQEDGERFIQDGAGKLAALAAPPGPCSPVKRQTFLVQDSPMKDLPPAIRHRLRRGNAAAEPTGLSAPLGASSPVAPGCKPSPDLDGQARPGEGLLSDSALMSVARMEGLQPKASSGPLTPSAGAIKPLQSHPQRPSALPTPLKRRASAIPTPTPGSQSRNRRPPRKQAASDSDCPPRTCLSPAPLDSKRAVPVDVQPFCLEEEPPAEPSQSESVKEPSRRDPSEPSQDLVHPESAKREVLLLDLPAPMAPTHEKLLIDLRNTPDWIRNAAKNCTATQQLIDLSSPLIKWSPEDKKENSAPPLINLS